MAEKVITKRTSGLIRSVRQDLRGPGNVGRVQGWIVYRAQYEVNVDISIFWNGDVHNTETSTVTLEPAGQGGAFFWNGDFYWGQDEPTGAVGEAFWGGEFPDRQEYRRATFDIAGHGDYFQWEIDVDALAEFEIHAIGFDLIEHHTPGY